MRLGRILAGLMPEEAEVHGLVALMELQAARLAARRAADGSPILLLDQDRTLWNRLMIGRGLAALERAETLGDPDGSYTLQAGIAACHARAARAELTDWVQIAGYYDRLLAVLPTPVVALNRSVAHGMAFGPQAGLALVDEIRGEPALRGYHLLAAVRGDLLEKLGRTDEAAAEFTRAAAMTRNEQERALLRARVSKITAPQD